MMSAPLFPCWGRAEERLLSRIAAGRAAACSSSMGSPVRGLKDSGSGSGLGETDCEGAGSEGDGETEAVGSGV